MANKYSHPGVFVEEIPGTRTIEGISTDVAAFIGVAETGPINQPTYVTSWDDYARNFGGFLWNRYLAYAVYSFFNEGGRVCYVVRAAANTGTPATASIPTSGGMTVTASATSEGSWASDISILIKNYSGSYPETTESQEESSIFDINVVTPVLTKGESSLSRQLLLLYVSKNGLPTIDVEGTAYYVLEKFSGFTANDLIADSSSDGLSPFESRINGLSLFISISCTRSSDSAPSRPTNGLIRLTGGQATDFNFSAALAALDLVQGFSILALPDSVTYSSESTTDSAQQAVNQRTLIQTALTMVEARGNVFFVADPPFGLATKSDNTVDITRVKDFKEATQNSDFAGNALNSQYGALYYPWLWINNPTNSARIIIPPSGAALGCYAATDNSIGVFKAPAGVNDGKISIAVDLETQVTDKQQDLLNPAGIDVIRSLLKYGITIWGARTLSLDPEWTYVSVRRLIIYIEQSIYESVQWVVFEPNDQRLWATVSRDITAFLTQIWRAGGLFGATPNEAFYIICDSSNNPPKLRDQGYLYIDVGIATVKPAEFVVLRVTQKTLMA
ncbi:MAG: Phage tail sheath protein [Gammaproteobacteria bacterium]|jgi:phage tail sheath protein FI|nr:Phage tail sheath protein [Gammaproteobacteria bacterium]